MKKGMKRKGLLLCALGSLMSILIGCGGTSVEPHKEGRLYVVNNVGWASNLVEGDDRYLNVEWEGEIWKIHPNMNQDGSPTMEGAVQLTPEPLPGGTPIDFIYYFHFVGDQKGLRLSEILKIIGEEAIIDGDITIDLYSVKWEPTSNTIYPYARVVRGKFDGIHSYPELTGGI